MHSDLTSSEDRHADYLSKFVEVLVFLVETDLVLAPDDPAFDEDAVNGLLIALGKYLKRAGYDSAEIIPTS